MATLCKPTGNSWKDIRDSGRVYYETIIDGALCRFYENWVGTWSLRIHGTGGLTMVWWDTKRELWDEGQALVRRLVADMRPHERPRYTGDDIRRNGGTPDVACRGGNPIR